MSSQAIVQQGEYSQTTNRLVWVLNKSDEAYTGTCQGVKVTVPGAREKIGKEFHQGGNLFPYITARHFITDYKEPQRWETDGNGKPQPIFSTKELYDKELTDDEVEEFVRKTPKQIQKEIVSQEKEARKTLSKNLEKTAHKVQLGDDDE